MQQAKDCVSLWSEPPLAQPRTTHLRHQGVCHFESLFRGHALAFAKEFNDAEKLRCSASEHPCQELGLGGRWS